MYRKVTAVLLMSTALAAGSAMAQSTSSPSSTPAPMASSGAATGAKFVTDQGTGEFRASKFSGLDIYGSENEKVGDVKEILFDGNGAIKTIVIGVGGFLGIGEKTVAVPFSEIEWKLDKPMTTASTKPSGMGAAPGGGAPMTTGSTAPTATAAPSRSPAEQAAYNGYPDHGVIKMTKAELKDAPTFKYFADTHSSSGAPSNAAPPAKQ